MYPRGTVSRASRDVQYVPAVSLWKGRRGSDSSARWAGENHEVGCRACQMAMVRSMLLGWGVSWREAVGRGGGEVPVMEPEEGVERGDGYNAHVPLLGVAPGVLGVPVGRAATPSMHAVVQGFAVVVDSGA